MVVGQVEAGRGELTCRPKLVLRLEGLVVGTDFVTKMSRENHFPLRKVLGGFRYSEERCIKIWPHFLFYLLITKGNGGFRPEPRSLQFGFLNVDTSSL